MLRSLRARVLVSHVAVIGLVIGLTLIVAYVPVKRAQNRLEVQRLMTVVEPLAVQTEFLLRQPAASPFVGELLDSQAEQMGARILLLGPRGTVLYDSDADHPLSAAAHNEIRHQMQEAPRAAVPRATAPHVVTHYAGLIDGQHALLTAVPPANDQVVAILAPTRAFPLGDLLLPLGLAACVGIIGALVATVFLTNSITRPIRRLTKAADGVAAGDLTLRVPGEGDDEVGRLNRSFNTMVERIRTTHESQRRLLTNIAHEFRTPLTSIQGYAQALRDGVFTSDDDRTAALATIDAESDRVNRLVGEILQLARLESGQSEPRLAPVNVAHLISRIVQRHQISAEAAGLQLVADADVRQPILADEGLLDQAIDNLVRNALRHTPAGGLITISAGPAVDSSVGLPLLRIRVTDTGEGIPPAEIPHIFDRFYRATPERTAGTAPDSGFGLGLAIVREIVAGHGGNVSVESWPSRGTTFMIDLPAGGTEPSAGGSEGET